MKYFTPKRLVRLQDHSNKQQFLAALDEWEEALEKYQQQLKKIQNHLQTLQVRPPELLKYLARESLHDAHVDRIGMDYHFGTDYPKNGRFYILLHPKFSPRHRVRLAYCLAQPPQIKHCVLPKQLRSEPTAWLYDELTLEGGTSKEKPLFYHTILLSDGSEIRLCFDDADYSSF
jgi:hypothetical protein